MAEHAITMMSESFQNDQTGEMVEGVTIIVDGKFKGILDALRGKYAECPDSIAVIQKALFLGLQQMIQERP